MLILDGRAVSFAEARDIERRHVEAAAADGDPDRYMRQVAEEVAAAAELRATPYALHIKEPEAPSVGASHTALRTRSKDYDIDEELAEFDRVDQCVVAFVGGGDNGGDALYACAFLAERCVRVSAFLLKPSPHPRALAAAREAGVAIVDLSDKPLRTVEGTPEWSTIQGAGVWIDGIVGIGAMGPLTGELARTVTRLNEVNAAKPRHVIAIDVPSGLTDDDGAIRGPILRATCTMAVGAYKRAEILPPAVEYSGTLETINMLWSSVPTSTDPDVNGTIGARDVYYYNDGCRAASVIPIPAFSDDKYARGVVGLVAGSDTYPGAGVLATRGALAAGVGMVRLNSTRRVQDLVLADQPGVVTVGGRIQSALIGPGLDEDRREDALELVQFCGQSGMPLVIDAWALDLVPELLGSLKPDATVLTPHYGEAARLLGRLGAPVTRAEVAAAPLRYARALHEATGCHVILKGPVTIVYSFEYVDTEVQEAFRRVLNAAEAWPDVDALPQGHLVRSYSPTVGQVTTSWAGVAGNGDVLAGFLAGVLARPVDEGDAMPGPDSQPQRVTPGRLAAAVSVHGRAAQVAADAAGGFTPIQASDIAAAIGKVLSQPTA